MDPVVPRHRRTLITVVVMMATIMHALDGTIANVALPSIQGSLSATQEQASWVVTSYIVASAIMTPLAGFCAVRFGLRRILVSAVVGFTVVSMLCGAANLKPPAGPRAPGTLIFVLTRKPLRLASLEALSLW